MASLDDLHNIWHDLILIFGGKARDGRKAASRHDAAA